MSTLPIMLDAILILRLLLLGCFLRGWTTDDFCVVYGLSFDWFHLNILQHLAENGLLGLFLSRLSSSLLCLCLLLILRTGFLTCQHDLAGRVGNGVPDLLLLRLSDNTLG